MQFDLLNCIFTDTHAVFTGADGAQTTFAELYVAALYASSKCSKVLKEKMHETPAFATEFAKIALLTNVGRINTTMACTCVHTYLGAPSAAGVYISTDRMTSRTVFPEMKTALRTYHPVPSLQKTDGNAQDAPRIKNCLKAAVLPSEAKSAPPSAPDEVIAKLVRPLLASQVCAALT